MVSHLQGLKCWQNHLTKVTKYLQLGPFTNIIYNRMKIVEHFPYCPFLQNIFCIFFISEENKWEAHTFRHANFPIFHALAGEKKTGDHTSRN